MELVIMLTQLYCAIGKIVAGILATILPIA